MLSLPGHVKLWVGHDYPPSGRQAATACATVADHRAANRHFKDSVTKEDFIALRATRDKTLAEPRLLHHALQMNLRGGRLPAPDAAGHRVLRLPLKMGGALQMENATKTHLESRM
jgi:hypothetical protein